MTGQITGGWQFIWAAFGVTVVGITVYGVWVCRAMCRAERALKNSALHNSEP